MSVGFRSALFGLAMTVFSWFGPWAWPAWPAFAAIQILFGHGGFAELPYAARSAVVVALIVVNVFVWGVMASVIQFLVRRMLGARRAAVV